MTRNLDIRLLRAFAVVADHRTMLAASQALHLSQGAISQQIARLEDLAGGHLLVRDRRGISLTSSGERLLGKVRRLLALHDELWADMNGGTVAGLVRFGAATDLVGGALAPVLKAFSDACPQVELSLVCGTSADLARKVAGKQLDLAVLEEPFGSITGECLAIDRLVWVGARGGTAHSRTPLPVSMVAEACAFRAAALGALRLQRREWKARFENGSLEAMFAMVRVDLAITAYLVTAAPADLDVLSFETGLPDLPPYAITLHVSDQAAGSAVNELARHIRDGLVRAPQVA